MDISILSRIKELEAENARLKKMYAEERLKAEIVQDALEKSGKAISAKRDGSVLCAASRDHYCQTGEFEILVGTSRRNIQKNLRLIQN